MPAPATRTPWFIELSRKISSLRAPSPAAGKSAPIGAMSDALRLDGTFKGAGFFGNVPRPGGGVSSELSMGANINGKEVEIPAMVPGLTKDQFAYLLETPPKQLGVSNPITMRAITKVAVDFARTREKAGKPYFAEPNEWSTYPRP